MLINSKNELEKRLILKNDELTGIKNRIQDIRKYGEIKPFDFHGIPQNKEIDFNKFLNTA